MNTDKTSIFKIQNSRKLQTQGAFKIGAHNSVVRVVRGSCGKTQPTGTHNRVVRSFFAFLERVLHQASSFKFGQCRLDWSLKIEVSLKFDVWSLKFLAASSTVLFIPLGSSAASLLLTGATVHTVSGETLVPGQVLIKDSKIAAVGRSLSADGATTLDLKGQHLYPGMIALNTTLGLTEIESVRATQDNTEVGDYTPDVESWIAVNPDSELLPVTRANGIAYFEPVPQGGVVAGQSGLVAMSGWTSEQMSVKKPLALHVFWPSMELDTSPRERAGRGREKPKSLEEQAKERRVKLQALADFFEEAKAYAKARDAAEKGSAPVPLKTPAWEAMLPYARGQLPIMVHALELRQIKSAVQWATTNQYKIILADARDGWMVADLLATNHIPVIYCETFSLTTRDTESYDAHFTAPEKLRKAGVQVAFGLSPKVFNAPLERNLPYEAAQAVAFGLPADEALKGLTLYPAQMAGVADRLGSIEAGKEATLFASDGDILDIRSNVKHFWIAGKEVSLESRHTKLYDKYKNRPKPASD
ncbi:MAG: amidohydrolase [Verrucomicrobia bacterium]|nr:MAG: amidohydrolase [Verrucomicrobiota bacterium]